MDGTGFTGGIAWLLMTAAYKHAPAATISPFHYSQIITGALLGYLIWHDVPTLHLMLGGTVIIGSGLYIAAHARKAGKAPLAPI
jgi:drug/metabolite transporter (DMT)-like permease